MRCHLFYFIVDSTRLLSIISLVVAGVLMWNPTWWVLLPLTIGIAAMEVHSHMRERWGGSCPTGQRS